jgi:hypothetical protein
VENADHEFHQQLHGTSKIELDRQLPARAKWAANGSSPVEARLAKPRPRPRTAPSALRVWPSSPRPALAGGGGCGSQLLSFGIIEKNIHPNGGVVPYASRLLTRLGGQAPGGCLKLGGGVAGDRLAVAEARDGDVERRELAQ